MIKTCVMRYINERASTACVTFAIEENNMKRLCLIGIVAIGLADSVMVHCQEYPVKALRIVTSPIGGGNDFPARLIAAAVAGPLGQQIVVDNRPTVLIADIVAKSPPDGYTLLLTGSAHWIGPLVEKVNYDPVRDFAALTLVDRSPNVLVVHPSLPAKNVKELITIAKARPGELNVAVGGPGSSNYVAAVLFGHMAGVNMTRIPYKGNAPAITALLSGEVQVMFSSAGAVAPHMQSGRLRALGVSSPNPSPLAPGVPSIASGGCAGLCVGGVARHVRAGKNATSDHRQAQCRSNALLTQRAGQRYFYQGGHRAFAIDAGGACRNHEC